MLAKQQPSGVFYTVAVGLGETKRPPPSVYPFKLGRRTTNPDGTERPKVVNFGFPLSILHTPYATEPPATQNARTL